MEESQKEFLKFAKKNVPKYCFMVWDIIKYPELVRVASTDDFQSFRVTYENHAMFTGKPNEELIADFNPIGEVSLSFDKEWQKLINYYFTDCTLIVPNFVDDNFNTFLCMRVTKGGFHNPVKEYKSKILTEDDYDLLSDKRKMYFYQQPATGIFIEKRNVACAFAPHILINTEYSFAIIRDVWTDPAYRGKGFATDVTAHLCEYLFDMGVKELLLWVEKSNLPAIKVYEKLGFQSEDIIYSKECKKS